MIDKENPELFLAALRNYQVVSDDQIEQARREHAITGEPLPSILKKHATITDEEIQNALAYHFAMEVASLKNVEIPKETIQLVPSEVARKLKIVPVGVEGRVLKVAISSPLAVSSLDEVRMRTGYDVEGVLASEAEIAAAIDKYYELSMGSVEDVLARMGEEVDVEALGEEGEEVGEGAAEDALIVKLVDSIIKTAIKMRASDIHLEPRERRFVLRYRIDGVLHEQPAPPKRLQGAVISRLKLMAGCDLAEKRVPQDGRIKIKDKASGKELDLRFSALPSMYGEALVMRILDKSGVQLGLEQVGFLPEYIEQFENLIKKPNGIILVTGPTGSGKTTTLYAALNRLNTPDRKIITVEDPVEYQLDGINQVQIKADIGLDFARGLRALLRQSPDVILVGEMRDLETAEIGIRAALTGHLVFSTLHTNDAPGAITRLIEMGINPFLVASSVEAVMAQRLVRTICKECRQAYEPTDREILEMGVEDRSAVEGVEFFRGAGCSSCNMTGYKGRTTITELMAMNEEIKDLVLANASSVEIRKAARRNGMKTLREYGFQKVKMGITTIVEVERVTPSELTLEQQR